MRGKANYQNHHQIARVTRVAEDGLGQRSPADFGGVVSPRAAACRHLVRSPQPTSNASQQSFVIDFRGSALQFEVVTMTVIYQSWARMSRVVSRRAYFVVFLTASLALAFGQDPVAPTNKWQLNVLGLIDSCPAIAKNGTIYFGTFKQRLWAVSSNGLPRWTFETGGEIKSSPAIGKDGTLYFGCRDRKFYAVSSKGKEQWEFKTGGWVDSSPALAEDGTIYFGAWDNNLYALKPDGTLRWKSPTRSEIQSSPAVGADGTIYLGSDDKSFYAFSPDGKKKWEYATGGAIISSPALGANGVIYFTSLDGFFYALNPNGTLRWRLKTGGSTESSPVIGVDRTIFVGVNRDLWAITVDGKKKWSVPAGTMMRASPTALADNSVCMVTPFGRLSVVRADGQIKWSFRSNDYAFDTPTIGKDGAIYSMSRTYLLYALDAHASLAQTPWPKFRACWSNTGNANCTSR